jgi:uncharacterized protein YodC (DUF2158 family)
MDLADLHPVGSVVTLAAGGGRMTVVSRTGSEARVAWLDDMGRPHELTVDVRALVAEDGHDDQSWREGIQ